jgi:hypothetical protein
MRLESVNEGVDDVNRSTHFVILEYWSFGLEEGCLKDFCLHFHFLFFFDKDFCYGFKVDFIKDTLIQQSSDHGWEKHPTNIRE